MSKQLLNFSEEELVQLLDLTESLGYMPMIDLSEVDYSRHYRLELRIIPILDEGEE